MKLSPSTKKQQKLSDIEKNEKISDIAYHILTQLRLSLIQIMEQGIASLPVVTLAMFFVGGIVIMQGSFMNINGMFPDLAKTVMPKLSVMSLARELGPITVGLILAGRNGTAMASTIASMKNSEQLEAMKSLYVNDIIYLGLPRLIALILICPLIIYVGSLAGITGSYIVGIIFFNYEPLSFLEEIINHAKWEHFSLGIQKGFAFGAIISSTGCYCGFRSDRGAIGIGRSSTNAVVYSFVAIIFTNYIITYIGT